MNVLSMFLTNRSTLINKMNSYLHVIFPIVTVSKFSLLKYFYPVNESRKHTNKAFGDTDSKNLLKHYSMDATKSYCIWSQRSNQLPLIYQMERSKTIIYKYCNDALSSLNNPLLKY
jgi:hypothetical protein